MVRAVESKPSQIKARRLIKQQPETVDELDQEEGISVKGGPANFINRARLSLPAPSTSLTASSNIRSRSRRQTSILPLRNIEPVPSRNVNIRQWRKSMLSGPPPDLEKRQEIVRVLANIALEALLTVGKVDEQGHVIIFDGPRVAHWKSFVACRKANLSGISGNDFLDAKALSTYGDMLNDPDSSFNSLVRLCNLTTFLYLIISSAPTDTNQYSKKAAANLKLAAWSFDTLVQPPNDTLHDGLLEMILSIKCQEYLAECSRTSSDSTRPDPAKYFGTHIYEAIEYGTEGRLPLSKVENLERREAETRYKSYSSRALSLAKDLDGDVAVLATRWVWNDVQDEVRNYCEELARRVAPRDEFRLSDESDDDEEGDVTMRVDQMMERGTSKQAAARREMDEEDESVLSQVDQSEGAEEGSIQIQSSPLRSDRSEQDRATLKEEEDDDDNEFVARSLGVSPATSRTSNFAGTVAVEKIAEKGEDEDQISDGDTEMGVEDSETQAYRMAEFADLEAELAEAQEADRSAALAIEMDAELIASLARDEEEEDREQDEGDNEENEQQKREKDEEEEEEAEDQEDEEKELLVTAPPARMNSMRKQVSTIVAETIQFKNGGLQRAPPKATKLSLLDRQADAEKILFDSQSQPSLSQSPPSPGPPPAQQRKQNKRHVLSDSETDDDDHSTQDVLTQLVPSAKKSKKSNKSVQPASSPSKQRTTRSMVSAASQGMSKVKKITRDAEKENLGEEEDDDDDDDDHDAMEAGRGRRSSLPALMEDEKMDEFSDEDQNQDQLQSGGQVDYPRDLHDDFQDYGGGEEYAAQDEEEEDELDDDEEEEEGEGAQVQQREVLVASAKKSQNSPTKFTGASNTTSKLAPTSTSTSKSASKSKSTTKPASKSSSQPSTSRRKREMDETTSEEESEDDSDEEEKAAAAKRKAKFEGKERKRVEERKKAKRRKAKGKHKAVSPPSDNSDDNNNEEEEEEDDEEEEEGETEKVKYRKAKGKGKAKPTSEEDELDDNSEPGLAPSARKEKKRNRLLYGRPIKRDVPTSPPSDKSSDDVPQTYVSGKGRGAGTKNRWTEEETELLHSEAKKYGISWAAMLKRHGPNGTKSTIFKHRDGYSLKDKARNIINRYLKDGTEIPKYFLGILESNAVKQRLATQPKRKELSSSSGSGSGGDDDDDDNVDDHGAAASARRAESSDSDESNSPSP